MENLQEGVKNTMELLDISLYALTGSSNPITMSLLGHIKRHLVELLIDIGSTQILGPFHHGWSSTAHDQMPKARSQDTRWICDHE